MSYVDPKNVLSPKNLVSDVKIIFNTGPGKDSWSVAKLMWNGQPTIGIRWNGQGEDSGVGNPQSRGNPTWFIVPEQLAPHVLEEAESLAKKSSRSLVAGYREMAADQEREAEAQEWSEGLVGDIP